MEIVPIKPIDGLVAFATCVLDTDIYLGSIGIQTRPNGGYRLIYPTKKVGLKNLSIFHPINKKIATQIEEQIISKYEEVMKNDRHHSTATN